jgi:hypothetical protein
MQLIGFPGQKKKKRRNIKMSLDSNRQVITALKCVYYLIDEGKRIMQPLDIYEQLKFETAFSLDYGYEND